MQHGKSERLAVQANSSPSRVRQRRNDVMQANLCSESGQATELSESDRRWRSTPTRINNNRHPRNGIQHNMEIRLVQRPGRHSSHRMDKLLALALSFYRRFRFFQRELSKTLLLMPAVRYRRFHSVTGGQPRRHNQNAEEMSHGKKLSQPCQQVNAIRLGMPANPRQKSITRRLSLKNAAKNQNVITLTTQQDVISATSQRFRKNRLRSGRSRIDRNWCFFSNRQNRTLIFSVRHKLCRKFSSTGTLQSELKGDTRL
jgi:hypothetical protein